jgi:OmcA/MtrC family decaheme c-type cytochrome
MIRILSRFIGTGFALVFALSLFGCGSDISDSASGQGEADPVELVLQTFSEGCRLCHDPGSIVDVDKEHSIETNSPAAEITGVTIVGGTMTVSFKIYDSENPLIPIGSVSDSSIRFTVAQLDANGDWQSYINRTETKAVGDPGTTADGTTEVQATYEKADKAGGTFTDNGDGTYSYQFSFDITNVTTPVVVTYDASLTHRIAMQLSGNVNNAFLDFVPNDLPLTGTGTTRDIVMNASCNECHVKLGFHGSDRIAVEYCVTCHNPGSSDAHSGNSVDLTVMIHKIHMGEELPSVIAGGEYAIWGYRDSKHDYSTVVHPQDIRNCTKCHDAADTATPEGDNWKDVPTMEACGSCHDDIDFGAGTGHSVQADNSGCATCHPATGAVATGKSVVDAHEIAAQIAAKNLELNILAVSTAAGTAGALNVTIQFSVTDPLNADLEYDIFDTTTVDLTPLGFLIGWETSDYGNKGSGSTPAQPIRAGVSDATGDANNIFTLTVTNAVPAGVTGSGVVGLQGHPYKDLDGDGDVDDRVPVKSVFKSFAITDATAQDRRDVVDIDKCNKCHESLSLHGSNRTDEIQVCVICHNARATDISVRPADATTTPDGKAEETIDFKYMIHSIHAGDKDEHGFRENGIVVYGYRGSVHDYSHVRFPGNLNNCEACHESGTYELPLDDKVQTTTIKTGSDLADPDDDITITPTSSVCSSCHDNLTNRTHMTEEGGRFDLISYYISQRKRRPTQTDRVEHNRQGTPTG